MRYPLAFFAIASATLAAAPVMADGYAMGANIGTRGIGIDATVGITSHLNLRGVLGTLDYSDDRTENEIRYDGELKLRSAGLLLDWLPGGGGFRATIGALTNGNKFKGVGTTDDTFTINDVDYLIDGRLDGEFDWRRFAPYLGLGWGNPIGAQGRISFSFDAGVMFTGSPDARIDATGRYSTDGGATFTAIDLDDPQSDFTRDLTREQERLRQEVSDFKYWPVIQLGLNYRF
jgi:hypothetical protein